MNNGILVRLNEIGIKSRKKRPFFERSAINAIQDAFTRSQITDYKIKNIGQLFLIKTSCVDDLIPVLKKIPGIQHFSPCIYFPFTSFDDTVAKTLELAKPFVKDKTFRVTAKRSTSPGYTSMQLAAKCGEVIMDFSAGVSLRNPDVNIGIEVRGPDCFFYTEFIAGLGGMPPKSAGKSLCLFSGGLDSPVAAYQMLKRGLVLDYVFVNLLGETALSQVAPVYNYLVSEYQYSYKPNFFEINGLPLVEFLNKNVPGTIRQIALKIAFYKISERLCKEYRLWGVVTGEALSQKSSQTLQSLSFIQENTSVFTLRPLLSMDKLDIIAIAQQIGTFASSQAVKEMCSLSDGPVTAVPIKKDIHKIPDMDEVIDQIVASVKVTSGLLPVDDLSSSNILSTDELVVDLRLPSAIKKDPIGADLNFVYPDVLQQLDKFEEGKNYLLVCPHGVIGIEIAYLLKKKKITARSLSVKDFLKIKNGE